MEEPAQILAYDEVDSTSSEAFRMADAGQRGPIWVIARRQTAGRGRLGRHWESHVGNLHTSLLLTFDAMPQDAFPLSLLAGIALHEAVAPILNQAPVRLKWPNDLIDAHNRKLAGILLESRNLTTTGGVALVLGFGVNVATAPEGLGIETTSLTALGAGISVDAVFSNLIDQVENWLAQWHASPRHRAGRTRFQAAWSERAMTVGQEISARVTAGDAVRGRFNGITDEGSLKLGLANGGERIISVGDISLL